MDSLTQIVLGAAVGEATLGKKIGNKALLYGAIAGTIPDLDVIFGKFTDTITAIEWHRGFSHSIVFCLIFSPILGWFVNKIESKYCLGWKSWAKLFFWGLFTHPLLDAFTTWGTQLFWPLDYKVAFNSVFVIDPLYTLPLLLTCIMVLFKKKNNPARLKICKTGLYISSIYLIIGFCMKFYINSKFEDALNNKKLTYSKFSTRPSPFNIILWNANIDTESAYLIADYSLFDTKPISFKTFPKRRAEAEEIIKYNNVKRLIAISEGWYILENTENGWVFNDLRFGLIPQKDNTNTFAFSYYLEKKEDKIQAVEVPKSREDAYYILTLLLNRIKGN